MPENDKEKNVEDEKSEETADKTSSSEERSYYYDDACGYEIYDADKETEEDS